MLIAIIISAICSLCEACLSSTPMSFVSILKGKSGADILRNFKENMDKPLSEVNLQELDNEFKTKTEEVLN